MEYITSNEMRRGERKKEKLRKKKARKEGERNEILQLNYQDGSF